MSAPFDPMRASSEPDAEPRPTIPDSISIAVELWVVVVVGQIVALFAQTGTFVDLVRDQVDANPPQGVSGDQLEFMTSSGFVVGMLVVMSVVLTAITALVVWFTRKGHNWARIVLGAMGVYIVVNLLFSLFGDTEPAWAMVPLVIGGVAALGATVLLLRGDSEKYCRRKAEERRSRAAAPAAPPYPYAQNPWAPNNPHGQNNTYGQNNPYAQNPYGHSPNPVPPPHGSPSDPGAQAGDAPYGDSSPGAAHGGTPDLGKAPDLRKPARPGPDTDRNPDPDTEGPKKQ